MNRDEYFSRLPIMDAQFGNLVVIRDKAERRDIAGAQECFVSSVLQFQPLARLRLRDAEGHEIPLALTSSSSNPVFSRKTFDGAGVRLAQELTVSGDEASLSVTIDGEPCKN